MKTTLKTWLSKGEGNVKDSFIQVPMETQHVAVTRRTGESWRALKSSRPGPASVLNDDVQTRDISEDCRYRTFDRKQDTGGHV